MLRCLCNEPDSISDKCSILLRHFQPELEEFVQIRHNLIEDIVLEDLLYGFGAKAITDIEVSGKVNTAHLVKARVHNCFLTFHHLLITFAPIQLDLYELLQILIHALVTIKIKMM